MPTVLITGASRGFGRALLDVYSLRSWETFPLVRNSGMAAQLQAKGGSMCHPIIADVSTQGAEHEIARMLGRHTDALDVLINNAGNIVKHRGLHNTSIKDLEDLFDVHCVGAFRCTKSALPFLTQSVRPVVVNISSRWGSICRNASGKNRNAFPTLNGNQESGDILSGEAIYSYQIAKCALNMLTVCLDQELRKSGIRVMAVHPGRLKTEAGAPDADTEPQEAARALADWIERIDERTACGLYDLMGERYIEW